MITITNIPTITHGRYLTVFSINFLFKNVNQKSYDTSYGNRAAYD